MASVAQLNRLLQLEERACERANKTEAARSLETGRLTADEDDRFYQLWDTREAGLTESEMEELFRLLRKCRIVTDTEDEVDEDDDTGEDLDPDDGEESVVDVDTAAEDQDQEVENSEADDSDGDDAPVNDWDPAELAFVIAFHRYAQHYKSIDLPKLENLLDEFLIGTGCRLFQKYGWTVDQPDCSTMRPFGEWAMVDRWRLHQLYGVRAPNVRFVYVG